MVSRDYNMQTNPELRDALEPSLRLASGVLAAHPIFRTLSNIYNLRQVPRQRDGRSPEQIKREGGLTAVWYSEDGLEHQMYPSARDLLRSGHFEEGVSLFRRQILHLSTHV